MMANITVLNCQKRMTKVFTPKGKQDYDKGYIYSADSFDIDDLEDLSELLMWLENKPHELVIRGVLNDGIDGSKVLRRKDAYDGEQAYFHEAKEGVHWAMIDFDKIPCPQILLPSKRIEYLIGWLPAYCHDVSYHYQWSSSSGIDGWKTLSCHVWFWLEEPRTDTQMVEWAKHTNEHHCGNKVIDPSPLNTVQPNYTAAPIFIDVEDPMGGNRSGLVKKARDTLPVPVVEYTPVADLQALHKPRATSWQGGCRFDDLLATIGPDFHEPITKAIASWVVSTGSPTDVGALKSRLRSCIAAAPQGQNPKETYTNEQYLENSIRGAIRKFAPLDINRTTRLPETKKEWVKWKLTGGKII